VTDPVQLAPLDLDEVFAGVADTWSPRVVGAVNDYDVKVARGAGEFPEHAQGVQGTTGQRLVP